MEGGGGNSFTPEQTSQLLHLLKLGEIAKAGVTTSDVNANVIQCVGNIFTNPLTYYSHMKSESWIIDSDASEHMSFDPQFFSTLNPLPFLVSINLPNSFSIKVTYAGSVNLSSTLTLHNVFLFYLSKSTRSL